MQMSCLFYFIFASFIMPIEYVFSHSYQASFSPANYISLALNFDKHFDTRDQDIMGMSRSEITIETWSWVLDQISHV